jgi:hypothetical protein
MTLRFPRLLPFLFLLASIANAQDLSQFEKVLVPVLNMNPLHGANGSTFSSRFDVLSDEVRPVTYYPAWTAAGPSVRQNEPQLLQLPVWEAAVVAKGRFVFFEKNRPDLVLGSSVEATAPDGSTAVTPIPVVREHDVRSGKSTFMTLATHPISSSTVTGPIIVHQLIGWRERYTLRIYDWDSTGTLRVAVRLRYGTWIIRGVVGETVVSVNQRDADDPTYPYYAEITLDEHLFSSWCYLGTLNQCGGSQNIVEVEPLNPAARYYAFISMTDNATNHVAIFTPR